MHKLAMFAVMDKATNLFADPWPAYNPAAAVRNFRVACLNPDTQMFHQPGDFVLYEVSVFDKEIGLMLEYDDPIRIVSGDEVIDEKRNDASVLTGAKGGNSEIDVRPESRTQNDV